jgi:hypothetical protein
LKLLKNRSSKDWYAPTYDKLAQNVGQEVSADLLSLSEVADAIDSGSLAPCAYWMTDWRTLAARSCPGIFLLLISTQCAGLQIIVSRY